MAESFGAALNRLWPHGDERIPGLRAGMIATGPSVFKRYGINSPLLIAHVMAQISHECGAGHDVVENLNYKASRMMEVWPSRFPTLDSASPYAGNPRALANKVYNGRMGNVSGSDDGWNFRGRGGAQTTGREGYERLKASTGLNLVIQPDLVNDTKFFLECAVADFVNCGCMAFARADDILNVTRKLNGGTTGLDDRVVWLAKWKAANVAVPLPKDSGAVPPIVILPPNPLPPDMPLPLPPLRPEPPSITNPAKGSIGAWIASVFAVIAAAFKRKP
jgi:putative chitinase